MAVVDGRLFTGVASVAGRACPLPSEGRPYLVLTNFCSSSEGVVSRSRGVGGLGSLPDPTPKIVTWLILPVVICLSQRLSHACLSISNHTVKLRMAH
jgi:hypothetical protein